MRSVRFSRVRATACFMRSKNEGFSSVLPNKVWIIAIAHYTGRGGDAVRMIMADALLADSTVLYGCRSGSSLTDKPTAKKLMISTASLRS